MRCQQLPSKLTSALGKLNPKRLVTGEAVRDGFMLTKWFGLAYYDFDRDVRVSYLIPLNWIVWFWHNKLRYWLKVPPRDEELQRVYSLGFKRGRGWE